MSTSSKLVLLQPNGKNEEECMQIVILSLKLIECERKRESEREGLRQKSIQTLDYITNGAKNINHCFRTFSNHYRSMADSTHVIFIP